MPIRYNKSTNPYAASAPSANLVASGGGSVSRVTGLTGYDRTTGTRYVKSTSAGLAIVYFDYNVLSASAGQYWSNTVQFRPSAAGSFDFYISFLDSAGAGIGNGEVMQNISVSANQTMRVNAGGTAPANTARVCGALVNSNMAASSNFTWTAYRIEQGNYPTLEYGDGSSGFGWSWDGATGTSASTYNAEIISVSDSATSNESRSSSTNNTTPPLYGNAWDWEPNGITLTNNSIYPYDAGPDMQVLCPDTSSVTTVNNRLQVTWAAGGSSTTQAVYLDHPTPKTIKYFTSTFGFGPGADANGCSICMATWDMDHVIFGGSTKAQIHLSITRSNWQYYILDGSGGVPLLASGAFSSTLIADWRRYTATVSISGNVATVNLPDGSTTTVTDARIETYQGYTACFEFYRQNNTYSGPIALYRTFASDGQNAPNPLGRDNFVLSDVSLLDNTGGAKLGTDSALMNESVSLFATRATSDSAASSEARSGATSAVGSDLGALNEQYSTLASSIASDTAITTESYSVFQGLLKDVTELASFIEQTSLFTTHSRTDSASGNDTRQGGASFYTADLYITSDQVTRQNILTSDLISFTDLTNPGFNEIQALDFFTAYDLGEGNFPRFLSDLFTLNEQANVFEKTIITEDPFVYPVSYYGTERVRVIAQDHFTREFLHWDLPLDNLQLTFTLSGHNLIVGTLSTEMESVPELLPDRTWLHVEQGNTIIASFIMTPPIDNPQSQTRQIEGEGFSSYPHWNYYEDNQFLGIQVDPADMIRKLWDHIQSYPDGNLNVKLWPTVTSVRIGYPNNSVQFRTKEGNEVSIQGEPYNLNFWSAINVGEEINRLCQETPIEFWEYSQWNETKTNVEHYIVLGYPRVGYKRTDLVFREGENLVQLIPSYHENQESYASDVLVIGAGEGPGAVRAKKSGRIGRLRKTNIIQDQNISNKKRAQAIADFEFNRISQSRFLIENITVDTTHTNARWGTFVAGDDIYVQCYVPYVGQVQEWYRITTYTYNPYTNVAELTLEPSDSFSYGGSFYNPYEDLPHEGFAVLSDADFDLSDQSDEDQIRAYNIKICQQQGVEAFNKSNIAAGFAYAYSPVGTTTNYIMRKITIAEAIDPWAIVLARTSQGYLITGENVYLVASNGTIGQAPESQSETPRIEYSNTGQYSASRNAPFPPGLQLAAREYRNAFVGNIYISPELTYLGMSANASSWRQTLGYLFYTVLGGQYNYEIKSPGGQFVFMVGNISGNIGF